ncbi:MAG: hypothetical protein MR902_08925 [Campylobacter sp.]|nr:hypothetical protein [Campylobacter sp.]
MRVRYLRALSKFANSAIILIKRDDFDEEIFKKRVEKNYEILIKSPSVYLDQPYAKALESFVNSVVELKPRDELVKEANLLLKLKNSKNYKKEKHKKINYE